MTVTTRRLTSLAIALALALVGCGGASPSAVARPSVPPGWTAITSDAGDVSIALPPWIEPFDTGGPVFANEPPPADGAWIELMAMGPGTAPPPAGSFDDARQWTERWIASPIAGPATITTVELQGGTTIRIERLDGAGTPGAWRVAAYGYRTPAGMAALIIDGPPAAWAGREADLALIPQLVRFAPARPLRAVPLPATQPAPAPQPDGG